MFNVEELLAKLTPCSRAVSLTDPRTLAVVMQQPNSTHNTPWGLKGDPSKVLDQPLLKLWEDVPGQDSRIPYVFYDTVVLNIPVEVSILAIGTKKNGTLEQKTELKDAKAADNLSRHILNGRPEVNGIYQENGIYYQQYRISTCNLHPTEVDAALARVDAGEFKALVHGEWVLVQLVKSDLTSNLATTVIPANYQEKLTYGIPGGIPMDNQKYVGLNCHSYSMEEELGTESKIYSKLCFMLEAASVEKRFGCNLPNILESNQRNIQEGFGNAQVHEHGFSRTETRFRYYVPLAEALEQHLYYTELLVDRHCSSLSLQEGFDSFLKQGHYQSLVVVKDLSTGNYRAAFCRWANALTGKGNGQYWEWDFRTLEKVFHYLQYQTIGKYPISLYSCEIESQKDKQMVIVGTGLLQADSNHNGNLFEVRGSHRTQASGSGISFTQRGISIPLITTGYNSKERLLQLKGNAYVPADIQTLTQQEQSEKTAVRKAKKEQEAFNKKAAKNAAALVKAKTAKWVEIQKQVAQDKLATCPGWRDIQHISKLSELKKAVCTAYRANVDTHGNYAVKVGAKWYKGNGSLNKLLYKSPVVPFQLLVTDSGRLWEGKKVWEARLEYLEEDPTPVYQF